MKRTAIIIINWNSYDCTNDCLESLSRTTYLDYDIILVNNGSKDDSGERLKAKFPGLIYIDLPVNLGFTGSNNVAMNYSINRDYEFTMLLNNDTFVNEDFLEELVEYLDVHPEAGAIQPKIYFNHNRELLWNGGSYFTRWRGKDYVEGTGLKATSRSESIQQPDWLTGCALLIRNEVIRKVGLLDESLFMYYDDVDYSFRIKKAGYELVYHPASPIYHIAGAAYRNKKKSKEGFLNPIVHYFINRNRIWVIKKYLPVIYQLTALLVFIPYLLGMIGYFLLRGRFAKSGMIWKALKDGFSGKMETKYRFDKSI